VRLPALALLLATAACAAAGDDATTAGNAPLIGVDGTADAADRACHVVLRDLARPSNGTGGWQTSGSSWVWTGTIDISTEAALEGSDPRVLYHYGSSPTWWQAAAVPSDAPAPPGMTRYTVTLDHDLPGPGMSGTALATATVEVVPFLALVEGGRLFDHNRHPGDFDNYILNLGNSFSVGAAPSVCPGSDAPPPARLVFAADWTETAIGALAGGGRVRIEYDLARLAACRNTTHGHPLWDVVAHTRWEPSGAVESHSVRDGQPTLAIPPGTTAAVLWFENTQIGGGCHAWDSDYGANYTFAVSP
jgi:hypothetical protein